MNKKVNLAASIRARLLNRAKTDNTDFSLVLTRYSLERLLFRLSLSEYRDSFLLKGALLFDLWFDISHRPTRDVDFLGFGSSDLGRITSLFQKLCKIEVPDGIRFQSESVRALEIRKESNYAGVRVTLLSVLDGAQCPVQIDIGFGDAVTPGAENAIYPVILDDLSAPNLLIYPKYTVVAEKFETIAALGIINTRLKDYFDLWILAQYTDFDGVILQSAMSATFRQRETPLPITLPLGLSKEFYEDPIKKSQWHAFLSRNRLTAPSLQDIVTSLSVFLLAPLEVAAGDSKFQLYWKCGGPWS